MYYNNNNIIIERIKTKYERIKYIPGVIKKYKYNDYLHFSISKYFNDIIICQWHTDCRHLNLSSFTLHLGRDLNILFVLQ